MLLIASQVAVAQTDNSKNGFYALKQTTDLQFQNLNDMAIKTQNVSPEISKTEAAFDSKLSVSDFRMAIARQKLTQLFFLAKIVVGKVAEKQEADSRL